jgi:AcrR family transcriptional regulator
LPASGKGVRCEVRTSDPSKVPRILEAAGQLFAERHYHEVRMEDIATRAGVAKGTLYLHFHCKDDLYAGLIRDGLARLADRIEERLGDAPGGERKVRVLVSEAIRFFGQFGYLVELGRRVEAQADGSGVAALQQSRERFLGLMVGILRGFPGAGRLSDVDLRLGAMALAGMLREVLSLHPQPWPGDLDERLTRLFVDGFRRTLPS